MDITAMYIELIYELVKYSRLDHLKMIKYQLEADIQTVGYEERLIYKYKLVVHAIEEVMGQMNNAKTINKLENKKERS